MANKIMKSAILPASRYKDDWLSHRNLKNHSSGVNYNTRAFAKSQGQLMSKNARNCKFYDVSQPCQEKSGRNDFSLFTIFRYFFFFSHIPNGALKFNKFCENCEKSWSQRFAAFYHFITYLLFSIAREGLRFQLIPRKVRKIFPYFTIFPYVYIAQQKGRCKTQSSCIALKALLHSH